jgi:hypothetical protein
MSAACSELNPALMRANATPLLAGQSGGDIPGPNQVGVWEVRDYFVAPEAAWSKPLR